MGLGFLGRGKGTRWRLIGVMVLHVLGATMGGTITGTTLSWLGTLLPVTPLRPALIAGAAISALWHSLSLPPRTLGLHRQVPRDWAYTMPPELRFLLWGMLLGSGVAVLIPHSAFIVLLVTQFTAGVTLGGVSGALFGATRGLMALLLLSSRESWLHPETLSLVLPKFFTRVQRLNVLWIVGGGLLLVFSTLH